MPTGLKRYYGDDGLHFITSSCYQRRAFFSSPETRDLFLRVLELMRNRYRFVVFGYVIMPEHIHLLINEPERGNPSVVIQALKLGFVRSLPTSPKTGEKWGTQESGPNHFWQKRFYDFNVWSTPKIGEKLKYMHRNPVVRGLVARPEDWRWSSFRCYACGEVGIVRLNDWSVMKKKLVCV